MNGTTAFTKKSTFRILYARYKDYLVPSVIIFVCIIVFFQFNLPQIQDTISLYNHVSDTSSRINIINSNINFASKLDDTTITKDLQTAVKALPQEKDFAGMLDAVSNAAVSSAVVLGDYSVSVGDVSGVAAQNTSSTLQIALSITGGIQDIERFLLSLKDQLPISNIIEVRIDNGVNSRVTLEFYYKPFPKIDFVPSVPLTDLSQKDKDLLNKYSSIATPSF